MEILNNLEIKNISCPFCQIDSDRFIVGESDLSFAIHDKFPVSKGHVLIIPKRHCENFFVLNINEQNDAFGLVNKMKKYLDLEFSPDGYNIGINIGAAAGQTINHVHIHIIPRYNGDMTDPKGGVRGVIPDKQKY